MRKELADKYIRGRGIEIGGLHNPLPIPLGAKVTYVDRLPPDQAHPDVTGKVQNVVIDDAEKLENFELDSLDFIIANHVIEHCRDPIRALIVWANHLTPLGIVFAAVPEKTQTFDAPRAITKIEHLIADHQIGLENNSRDAEHYREWLSIIDKVQEPELTKRVEQCLKDRANIHFHVWDERAMLELLAYMGQVFEIVEFVKNGAEIIWILRKL